MIKLNHNITFSLKTIKGSYEMRQSKIEQLCHKLYNELEPQFKNDRIQLKQINQTINRILPEKTIIRVQKYDKEDLLIYPNDLAYSYQSYSPYSNVATAHNIKLRDEGKGIKKEDLPIIIHEFRHIADLLYHPKFLLRDQKSNYLYDKYNKDTFIIFDRFVNQYKFDRICKSNLKRLLRGKTAEEKADYLQNLRYYIMSEDNALRTDYHFAKIMKKHNQNINNEIGCNEANISGYKEAQKYVENLLYRIIKYERKRHARQLEEKSVKKTLTPNKFTFSCKA